MNGYDVELSEQLNSLVWSACSGWWQDQEAKGGEAEGGGSGHEHQEHHCCCPAHGAHALCSALHMGDEQCLLKPQHCACFIWPRWVSIHLGFLPAVCIVSSAFDRYIPVNIYTYIVYLYILCVCMNVCMCTCMYAHMPLNMYVSWHL